MNKCVARCVCSERLLYRETYFKILQTPTSKFIFSSLVIMYLYSYGTSLENLFKHQDIVHSDLSLYSHHLYVLLSINVARRNQILQLVTIGTWVSALDMLLQRAPSGKVLIKKMFPLALGQFVAFSKEILQELSNFQGAVGFPIIPVDIF